MRAGSKAAAWIPSGIAMMAWQAGTGPRLGLRRGTRLGPDGPIDNILKFSQKNVSMT